MVALVLPAPDGTLVLQKMPHTDTLLICNLEKLVAALSTSTFGSFPK